MKSCFRPILFSCAIAGFLLILSPVPRLLAQEKQGFERWEDDIAAFERRDAQNPPPENAVLFVGSSSIRLWDLEMSFPKIETINRGFGGSQIADSVHFADRIVLKHKPRIVVMYAGDNDINAGKSPERVAADFKKFIKTVHADLPETRILFIAIKPSIKRWALAGKMKQANRRIKKICDTNDLLAYIDIFTPMLGPDGRPREELFVEDGLHLNETGYQLWADRVAPHLK